MTALTKLDLAMNALRTFPDAFHFPPNLKHISIAKCKVHCQPVHDACVTCLCQLEP